MKRGYCGRFLINIGFDYRGWGLEWPGLASWIGGLLDWLVEGVGGDNVSTCVNIISGDYERVHCKKPSSSFVNIMY